MQYKSFLKFYLPLHYAQALKSNVPKTRIFIQIRKTDHTEILASKKRTLSYVDKL
jgi:hypothetical protein